MNEKQVLQNSFSNLIAFPRLEEANRNAKKQKRYRDEIIKFNNDLDANLLQIRDDLENECFKFGPYRKHWVSVPKRRLVMALPYASRIVQWAIYLELNPFYDRMMIEDSYACRKGKGSLAAAKRLQYWLQQAESKPCKQYVLKLDISKYFYRVDHAVLLDILGE